MMQIGGFQKNTLIDFPGVVASLVFTQGCNFRCPYCHNSDLIPFSRAAALPALSQEVLPQKVLPQKIDEQEVFSFLKKRSGLIDGVAITGGEPTLQHGLESFCFRLKNMGLKVKLDTNGSRPKVLRELFRRELLDFVAMDVKSGIAGYSDIAGGSGDFDPSLLMESIHLIIGEAPAHEFRTTCVKPFVTPDTMSEILAMIQGASHHVLQHCSSNVPLFNPDFFQCDDPFCSDDEIKSFQQMARQRKQYCSIR